MATDDDHGQAAYEARIVNTWRSEPVPLPEGWAKDRHMTDEAAFSIALSRLPDVEPLLALIEAGRTLTDDQRKIVADTLRRRLTPTAERGRGRPVGAKNRHVSDRMLAAWFAQQQLDAVRKRGKRLPQGYRRQVIEALTSAFDGTNADEVAAILDKGRVTNPLI